MSGDASSSNLKLSRPRAATGADNGGSDSDDDDDDDDDDVSLWGRSGPRLSALDSAFLSRASHFRLCPRIFSSRSTGSDFLSISRR